jgi:hypothetical protein
MQLSCSRSAAVWHFVPMMAPADALCEAIRVLLAEAADFLAVRGLGVVVEDGPEHAIFTYVDGFGATGYRSRVDARRAPDRGIGFLYDLSTSPLERDANAIKAGGRSSIRVAIRPDETILGALSFTSRDPVPYTGLDLAVCRRIAEYSAGVNPEIGVTRPLGRWSAEAAAGVWLFTANDAYYLGPLRKKQEPVVSIQGHVSYCVQESDLAGPRAHMVRRRRNARENVLNPDEQRHTRLGGTISIPVGKFHSMKIVYGTGAATRRGTDFDSFSVHWQLSRY